MFELGQQQGTAKNIHIGVSTITIIIITEISAYNGTFEVLVIVTDGKGTTPVVT
jgi:hypothetical protein